jgi:PAS domain S-box-containing protein
VFARRVLTQLPVGVFVIGADGGTRFMNGCAAELLGPEDLSAGPSLSERYHVRHQGGGGYADVDLPLLRALRDGLPARGDDLEVAVPGAGVTPLEVIAAPILDDAGHVTEAVAAFWDVRERREVQHAAGLLAAVIGSTVLAVVSTDATGVITSWNAGAEATYGHRATETVGRRLDVVLPSSDSARTRAWQRALAGEAGAPVEVERIRKDGRTIVVEEFLSPLRTPTGDVIGVASVAQDVTDRRNVQEALAVTRRELERNLARLERSNAELEQFAYVASHDLSEPLRAVSGMVQLLARRYEGQLDDDADEFIAFAIDGCNRMKAMIDDVLAYSRAGRVEELPVPVDLAQIAQEVVASLEGPIQDAGATVRIGDLPSVHGVASSMRQLLQNLVSNAVKFRRPDAPPVVAVTAERKASLWQVCVEDNGIGIEPQYETRIFRMFQRLHGRDAYEGTGIGLAIAERLVTGFGGQIWVERRSSGGSRFCFTIPDPVEETT